MLRVSEDEYAELTGRPPLDPDPLTVEELYGNAWEARERTRLARLRTRVDDHFAELFAAAAVLGVFALSDPSDRVGFATGAVVASLAWLVARTEDSRRG